MTEETNKTNVTVFLDTIGRTIVGELLGNSDTSLEVKNPVILNVVPAEGGRMTVQLFPLFFREFLADKTDDVTFTFNKSTVVETDISALDFRLVAQYTQLFNKNNTFVPEGAVAGAQATQGASSSNDTVVNLFEE